jgi:predicted metal-dependent hydrolase
MSDEEEEPGVPTELDRRLLRGLDLMDAGEHYDAHEVLEDLWAGEVGAPRRLLQALIQLTVALHHRGNGNLRGAKALIERALEHVVAVRETCCELEPRALERSLRALNDELEAQRDAAEPRFDPALVPRFDEARARIRAGRRERGLPGI